MIVAFTGAGISKASGIPTFEENNLIREYLTAGYKKNHPDEFNEVLNNLVSSCSDKEPNDAHKVLAEYSIPVITMNIDGLHQKAGSKNVIELHGSVNNPNSIILYDMQAPMYSIADMIFYMLRPEDYIIIVGASDYTHIACEARRTKAKTIYCNENADKNLRKIIEEIYDKDTDVKKYSNIGEWVGHRQQEEYDKTHSRFDETIILDKENE